MPDRKSLVSILWLTPALTLLALVFVQPERMPGFFTGSPRVEGHGDPFALAPGDHTPVLNAALAADDVVRPKAIPSEDEEQDEANTPGEPRVMVLIPYSIRKIPARPPIAARSRLSFYPLRC